MSDVDTSRYDGTVERTRRWRGHPVERHLAYPVRDVWGAITNPAGWRRGGCRSTPTSPSISEKGVKIVMTGTGDEAMTITCAILRVEPPMLLEHTHAEPGRTCVGLEPVDSGCVLG